MALHFAADIQKLRAENSTLKSEISRLSNPPNQNALMIELSQLREENSRLRQSKIDLIMATAMEMERLRRFIGVLSDALRGKGFTAYDIRSIEQQIISNRSPKKSSRGDGRRASIDDNPDLGRTDTLHIGTSTTRGQKERKKSLDLLEAYPDFAADGSPSTSPEPLAGGIVNMVDEEPKPKKSSVKDIVQALSTLNKENEVPVPKSLTQRAEPAETRDSFHRHLPSAVNEFHHSGERKLSTGSDDSDHLELEIVQEENMITSATQPEQSEPKHVKSPPNTGRTTPAVTDRAHDKETRTPANTIVKKEEKITDPSEVASKTMSLKERMAALHGSMDQTDKAQEDRVAKIKEERKMNTVKVSGSKDKIGALFNKRIEKSKENVAAAGADEKSASVLKDALKEPTVEKAAVVMESLNLFTTLEKKPDYSKKAGKKEKPAADAPAGEQKDKEEEEEEVKHEVLNMNNNTMMKKMSDSERENMKELICQSLIANKELKQVQMCNADMDDEFLGRILDTLSKPECKESEIKELWFESNPIGNSGFTALGNFLRTNTTIEVIKMYNNKKDISTQVLNDFLDAMDSNKTLVKFVFDGFRLQQMRDKKDKILRRNQDLARKRRNEERKRAAAAAAAQ